MELSAQAIGLRSKFAEGLNFERPSSCPPVQRHQRDVSIGEAPTVSPNDVRLTKSYYDYYYSFSHSRNPRLPKPLIDWSHQENNPDGGPGGADGAGGIGGIGGAGGPGAGAGGPGLGMGESVNFARMASLGTGMGSKQALYRRSNPRSPHGDYPPNSGDSPPGPRGGGGAGGLGHSPSSGGAGSMPVGSGNSPLSTGTGGPSGGVGSEHSVDSQISPRFGSMPPNGGQARRRPFLDDADSLDVPFSKLSLSSNGEAQFDRAGNFNANFSGYPGPVTLPGVPTGGPGADFNGPLHTHHKAAPASLSSVGTGSSADGSAGLGPQPGAAGASGAGSPPFVPQTPNNMSGAGFPPHMHGGPLMSPAGGNPLRTPGNTTGGPAFWTADSPAADVPLANASTAELIQQLAIRGAGIGAGFPSDDRAAFSPQFGSPTAAGGYGAGQGFTSPKNRFGRQGSAGPLTPTSAGASGGASLQSLLLKGSNSKIDTRYLNRQKFSLMDIVRQDLVGTFSKDQHGSRLIQQKIQKASPQEQDAAFQQVEPAVLDLCLDIYGNYVVQKYFEHGQDRHKAILMQHMSGHILELSVDVFGCRVVQKALENVEPRTRLAILNELAVSVHRCVLDQNANHVLQKCIQVVESQHLDTIIDCFQANVKQYCMHSYGCRIMQRLLTYCTFAQTKRLLDEISKHALDLSANEYGNYVVQHVLKNGAPEYKKQVIDALIGHVLGLSRHKFASNVIEKAFEHGTAEQVQKLIMEISDNDCIAIMVGDQYANYVVQKILDFCNVEQKVRILKKIMEIPNFHKVAFGKHIIFAVDKLRASLRDRLNLEFEEHPENVAAFSAMHK